MYVCVVKTHPEVLEALSGVEVHTGDVKTQPRVIEPTKELCLFILEL
jgi:hypothetical protein